jgi:hypothetical protein
MRINGISLFYLVKSLGGTKNAGRKRKEKTKDIDCRR